MDKFIVKGGTRLEGVVQVSGAKNAALPLIAALILAKGESVLRNVPRLKDVNTLIALLSGMGARVSFTDNTITSNCDAIDKCYAPYELVRTMRASILVLGALLGRYGYAEVSLPGGCAIGSRPVDQHLKAFEAMGAVIEVENGYVKARTPNGLKGCDFAFDMVTVGGTQNALMAAVLADGTTRLQNCASEPEVVDLCHFLQKMGAHIDGIGTPSLTIEGVRHLDACEYQVIADRIEAGSYLAGALMSCGDVTVAGIDSALLASVLPKFEMMGAAIDVAGTQIRAQIHTRPKPLDIRTQPHPGFPTDMQAQAMAVCCLADGTSTIIENIFENRFMHVAELNRLGARIKVDGHTAMVTGVECFTAAPVMATDLRASMSLVMAAAVAKGQSTIDRIYHIDRGYENVEQKLRALGVDIKRVS